MVAFSFNFFLPFCLLLFLHRAYSIDLISRTCRKIVDGDPNVTFDFCLTTLQAVPESHSATLDGLGLIAIKMTKCNATKTIAYTIKLMNKHKVKPYVLNCLKDCLELYSDAVSSLDVAMNDVKLKRYFEANIHLSATMDASSTCEDAFKEKKGIRSLLSKRNRDMFQLSAIDLSIINMLSQNQV